MDWVQWYTAIMLTLSVVFCLFSHGLPKPDHDFRVDFVSILATLPWFGRVFGWW